MKVFKIINNLLAKSYGWVIVIFMACMIISLTIQIFYRYVLNIGLLWTEETSRLMCIWVAMLGTSILISESDHIRVSIIEDMFPKFKKYFTAIQNIVILIFSVFMVWFGFDSLEIASKSVSPSMRIPMLIVYLIFPISSVGMLVHSVYRVLVQFKPEKKEEIL